MKLFLFDIDGTLINSGGAGRKSLNATFKELYGINSATEGINPHGKTDPIIVREIFKDKLGREPSNEELKRVFERYVEYLKFFILKSDGYKVLPGVKRFLEVLSERNAILGLATGNIEEGAKIKLAPSGLLKFFSFGSYGSDSEIRKEIIRIAIERGNKRARELGGEITDIYVVGDTHHDIICAKEVNAYSVAVATGVYSEDELLSYSPDFIFKDFSSTEKLISRLNL
jgi:phosphoglycolate phosphatase-like HAD superfamily hydrolase